MPEETPVPVQPAPRPVVDVVNRAPLAEQPQNAPDELDEKKIDTSQKPKPEKPVPAKDHKSPAFVIFLAFVLCTGLIALAVYIKLQP